MRTVNTIKNIVIGLLVQVATIAIGVVAQSIFVRYMGLQYVGVTGVFSNIVGFLSIAELGVGIAIISSLYSPLAFSRTEEVKAIMNLYKKVYRVVALAVLIFGLAVIPFLKYTLKDITIDINLTLIFLLFLAESVLSYFFSYKRSILYADQKGYINNLTYFIFLLGLYAVQIFIIIETQNFILYLLAKVFFRLAENLYASWLVNKKYPYLQEKNIEKLDLAVKNKIVTNIKALFYHKIATVVVRGTDSVVISTVTGIIYAGLYRNYSVILSFLSGLIAIVFNSASASFGNLLAEEGERSYEVFNKLYFLNFWIYSVSSTCLINLMAPFITIWIGEKYLLSNFTEYAIVLYFFIDGMRLSISIPKESAGIFVNDKYIPIWESAVNLAASVILVKYLNIAGVFLGTVISTLLSVFISVPYLAFKYVLKRPVTIYYKTYFKYAAITFAMIITSLFVCKTIYFENIYISLLFKLLVSLVISNSYVVIIFMKNAEFKYFLDYGKKMLGQFISKSG